MTRNRLGLTPVLVLAALSAFGAVGCEDDQEHAQLDATMKADGYALFAVDNDRQQRNDVYVKIKDAEPGQTYALIYSGEAPKSSGWFQLDVNGRQRCGGDTGPHCEIPGGHGYLVDFVTVAQDAPRGEITLRDDRCGCGSNHSQHWTGHWAVLRVKRTNLENQLTVDVWAKREQKTIVTEPEITQLL